MPAASARDSTVQGVFHSVMNDTQSSAYLRIENCTKPSFVAFWPRREYAPRSTWINRTSASRLATTSRPRRLFFHL